MRPRWEQSAPRRAAPRRAADLTCCLLSESKRRSGPSPRPPAPLRRRGGDLRGELGNGQPNGENGYSALQPTRIGSEGSFTQVSVGSTGGCAISQMEKLLCWGWSEYGKTGTGSSAQAALLPTEVYGGGKWSQVSVGSDSSCAIKTDGSAWCFGRNNKGQLGNGGTLDSAVPVEVYSSSGYYWTSISSGKRGPPDDGEAACGIQSDGTAYCWGVNNDGELGSGRDPAVYSSYPVAVSGGYSWSTDPGAISVGSGFACGILGSGTAMCWGGGGNVSGSPREGEAALLPVGVAASDVTIQA